MISACMEECVPEGLYRHLQPVELDEWNYPSELPRTGAMLEMPAVTRLAIVTLYMRYLQQDTIKTRLALYRG